MGCVCVEGLPGKWEPGCEGRQYIFKIYPKMNRQAAYLFQFNIFEHEHVFVPPNTSEC